MQGGQILNLSFRGVGRPIGRDFDRDEREYWVTPGLLSTALDACMDREDVTLSFDGGNWSDIDLALPALQQRGLTATFFIVPGWLGEPGFISKLDLRDLVRSGMTIGNLGLQHRDWTALTRDRLEHEISQGRRLLEELTGTEIKTVAIPYNAYNDTVLDTLRHQGYEHVFTGDGGPADPAAWLQPREPMRASHRTDAVAELIGQLRPEA